MSDNIRIRTTPGSAPSSVNVNVSQKFDFIEILSLKISQDEAYRRFCSDYGTVVGRVIVNNGVGVPNAKVSIFIPIDDEDAIDPETLGLYPFEIVTGKDHNGIGYNLLPSNSRGKGECFTPIGSFPSKREIQDNPEMAYIYCKYYKFTTTTNDSGDYMIFGVPVGSHFLHVDVDFSDIGILSQKPYELINEGASKQSFTSPNKFKSRSETANPNQLKTFSPVSVDVVPFWGDIEECEIGISRHDINILKTKITPTALFMGSLISDSEKNSLNKRCRPRKKMGNHAELITGPGRIEMIRKTDSGKIERFDIDGGQVIDEDGIWSYLIPMNLDYIVTSEDGTIILSDDETRGIPTRTNVRFRIGMDTNGAEGKLRTRAKYLVPNNPANNTSIDYDFDESTNPESFVSLYWNKIYTVKNHIARVQPNKAVENRNFIGIKDVDEGASTPFPFNRMDNDVNPLFSLICTFLNIFVALLCVLNGLLIPAINLIIWTLNLILGVICAALALVTELVCILKYALCTSDCTNKRNKCRCSTCIADCDDADGDCIGNCLDGILPYIPYVTLSCSADPEGQKYAPCGYNGLLWVGEGWDATLEIQQGNGFAGFHYPVDGHVGHELWGAGWVECMAVALAEGLNVFKFDFYNDWVNGTLYSFLLKVKTKKKGRGKMKFCETDCEDDDLGVDNDNQNGSDNKCRKNFIVDSCTLSPPDSWNMQSGLVFGVDTKTYKRIDEGYIKYYKDEFYYSAISKVSGNKLFATDIVSLGSMVDCDWQGIPNIHKYFIDTTYNKPPLTAEYDGEVLPGSPGSIDVTGFDTKLNGNSERLIGNVFCALGAAGIETYWNNCVNIRRLSELGVGLDEDRGDQINNPTFVDNRITNNDVDNPFIRGAFVNANSINITNIPLVYFDLAIPAESIPPNISFGEGTEPNYETFRGRTIISNLKEYDNSFYFYFGLTPGKSALTKMNNKYFTECIPVDDSDFFIIGTVDAEDDELSGGTGQITINIVNGAVPYQIEWTGPVINGTPFTYSSINYLSQEQTLSNLYVGTYNVTVVDNLGNISEGTYYVPGPEPTTCDIQTVPVSINGGTDGQINVNITGGQNPYTIDVYYSDPNLNGFTTNPTYSATITSNSHTFNGMPSGDYYVEVTDSGTPTTQCSDTIEVPQPSSLNVSVSGNSISCYGEDDGFVYSVINGGDAPYTIVWTNNLNNQVSSGNTINNLAPGVYTANVTDANGQTGGGNYLVTEPQEITYVGPTITDTTSSGNDGTVTFSNINSEGNVELTTGTQSAIVGSGGIHTFTGLDSGIHTITLRDVINNCTKDVIVTIEEPPSPLIVSGVFNQGIDYFVTASGSWGNFPSIQNPANDYEYIWENSNNGGISWSVFSTNQVDHTYNPSTGEGRDEVNPTFQVNTIVKIRCRVRVRNNNTGPYDEIISNEYPL